MDQRFEPTEVPKPIESSISIPMKARKSKGKTILVITIIVLLIAAGAAAYWWRDKTANDSANKQAADTTELNTKLTNLNTELDATVLVGNFYTEYVESQTKSNYSHYTASQNDLATGDYNNRKALVAKYGSTNLISNYAQWSELDHVTLDQQYNGPFTVVGHKASGDNFIITVQQRSIYDGHIKSINVNVVNDDGLKIDSVIFVQ